MSSLITLTQKIIQFRDERDWKQFHNPKDVALSLVLEATEVMEHFQWKSEQEIVSYLQTHKEDIGKELADVLYWVLLMAHDAGINLEGSLENKLSENAKKYPVDLSKGNAIKYSKRS